KYDLASQSWIPLPGTLLGSAAFAVCGNFAGPAPAERRRPRRGARGRHTADQIALVPGSLSVTQQKGTGNPTSGPLSVEALASRDARAWLRDPASPHAMAATRPGVRLRGTLLLIVRCLLAFADAEFTVDAREAIARARILYETALGLLARPELNQHFGDCADLV